MRNEKSIQLRPVTKEEPLKICFVCLGNICRSPTAEGIFQHIVNREGLASFFEIDSAGTAAYHVGEPANSRSRDIAEKNGIKLLSRARKFEPLDLTYFDLIIAMDRENIRDIQALDSKKEHLSKIFLLRFFDPVPEDQQVPDPYYGGLDGFKEVFDIVTRSCEALLEQIRPYLKR